MGTDTNLSTLGGQCWSYLLTTACLSPAACGRLPQRHPSPVTTLPLWPPGPPWLAPHAPLWLSSPSLQATPAPPPYPPPGLPSPSRSHVPAYTSLSPQGTDSESEDAPPQHSFVNHYMSDPTYYNSWKRRAPGGRAPHRYEAVAGGEVGPHLHTVVTTQSAVFAPGGPGARTPLTGFSSFV